MQDTLTFIPKHLNVTSAVCGKRRMALPEGTTDWEAKDLTRYFGPTNCSWGFAGSKDGPSTMVIVTLAMKRQLDRTKPFYGRRVIDHEATKARLERAIAREERRMARN